MTAFNVAGLLAERPGATREYRLRDQYVALGADVQLAGPLDGWIRLQRTNRSILVSGSVDALLRRTCGRCTDAYEEAVRVTLSEEFLPSIDPETGVPLPRAEGEADAPRIDAHHQIDLAPILRDEIALTEPLAALCRPDCPGLCAGCGRRLDVGSCRCAELEPDPRLAVLGRLLPRDER